MDINLTRFFGPAIRYHRQSLRLSQDELAARAGLDRTYVSGIERSRRNPTLEVQQRLAGALGVSLDVIFTTARRLATQERS